MSSIVEESELAWDAQPPNTNMTEGTIIQFLRRNLFTVRLRTGEEITAAMPERLLPFAVKNLEAVGACSPRISARILLRQGPKLPLIVDAHLTHLCG